MRLLRAADHKRMPWKNGRGETIEIAVHPAEAGLADFEWRVSMAKVTADGLFSDFPGVDRTLALLCGDGMELDIEGQGKHLLQTGSEPIAFPGDVAALASLTSGPITDVNVMTRRNSHVHRLTRFLTGTKLSFVGGTKWMVILANGPATFFLNGDLLALEMNDAALLEDERCPAAYAPCLTSSVFVIEIDPVQ